jgi:LPS export ABC transporter protein LptC
VFLLLIFLSSGFGLQLGFSQEVTQQVDGFTLQGFNAQGDPSWKVNGDTADILGDTIKISNVDANTYGDNEVNIKARHGEVNKVSGNVRLQQDVVVTTSEGSQLKTDSLQWEKEKNTVSTPDRAVITDKAMKADGIGLTANSELKTAQLERNVTVEMDTEASEKTGEPQQIVITCDGPMELDQANNMAILRENVIAVRGEETLKADVIEVYFDPETRKIVTIVCTDNVSVQRGENISYSDKAIYNAADQKVIFVGRPKLIMKTDETENPFF